MNTASAPRLSILIINWNSKDYLRQCLRSIRLTCAELTPQIVVVDAGSFDGCGEMVATESPEVEFVQNRENLGFGHANNLGFEYTRGEYLLLLNPDTELQPGAVARMLDALQAWPPGGIAGPRLLNSDGSLQTSCVQALPTPWNQALGCELFRRLFPRSSVWGTWVAFHSKEPVEVEAVSGACMLMHRETFRTLGGFSPEYFMYGEDMDLCAKGRQSGSKIWHVPAAIVIHHGGGSTRNGFSRYSTICMRDSVYRFIRKHRGRAAAAFYRVTMACASLVRLSVLWPVALMPGKPNESRQMNALRKWSAVLRWSLGLDCAIGRQN